MDIIRIIGVGLAGAVAALVVKQTRPDIAIVIGLATTAALFFLVVGQLAYIFEVIRTIVDRLGINTEYIIAIIRIIGVAYITQLGADLCRDAGQTAVATKVEMAGKVAIVALSVPILIALMNLLVGILPG